MLRTEGLCSPGQICWSTGRHTHSHIWRETQMHICYTHLMDWRAQSTDNTHTFLYLCAFSHTHVDFVFVHKSCVNSLIYLYAVISHAYTKRKKK